MFIMHRYSQIPVIKVPTSVPQLLNGGPTNFGGKKIQAYICFGSESGITNPLLNHKLFRHLFTHHKVPAWLSTMLNSMFLTTV